MTTCNTLQPYIDLGWYTVPMKGSLERDNKGKKTLPSMEKGWRTIYKDRRNQLAASIGGVFTGSISGIVAIDCDNTETYQLFKSLDPKYEFHFVSKGKLDESGKVLQAGTIIYKHSPDLPEQFSQHGEGLSLDYYNEGGFIYLPTEHNYTKEPFILCDLKPMPDVVRVALANLRPKKADTSHDKLESCDYKVHLHPQIQMFLVSKQPSPSLFKILTPKEFRSLEAYKRKGYLYPDDVPDGEGSRYLSQMSAILGADESVDVDTYLSAMKLINSLFSEPMETSRLYHTIMERMVEGEAEIDGVPIWQYNEAWAEDRLQYVTKRDGVLSCFFDDMRRTYYAVDEVATKCQAFVRDAELFSYLATVCKSPPGKKPHMVAALPLAQAVNTPTKDFGFYQDGGDLVFNTFASSRELRIFKNPKEYASVYQKPTTILNFLCSLIPDAFMRNYVLGFMKRKLTNFEYSPVVLFFLGVNGSGKDTFVSIFEKIIGSDAVARPKVDEFLEKHNGWLLDKYFVQLDEYGNQLSDFRNREKALGLLKAYSGKSQVQIRRMASDGFNYEHNATFISTANKNPLIPDDGDRRLAVINTPNKLGQQQWVDELGGLKRTQDRIAAEVADFAYYLATEVNQLSDNDYQTPPETREKLLLIADSYAAGPRLAYMLRNRLFTELQQLAEENECYNLFERSDRGRIYEDDLFQLYEEMTGGNGQRRGLAQVMKGFEKRQTTTTVPGSTRREKKHYYFIPNLDVHNFKRQDNDTLTSSKLGAIEDDD